MEKIEIVRGDITKMQVDAIVNAANTSLLGGGGVDGAIHCAAGPALTRECAELGGCAIGDAKITKGYNLPAKWVIHTVGPEWRGGKNIEDEMLAWCYRNSLALAKENGIKTIAFPSISTGANMFPLERAAKVAINEIIDFLKRDTSLEKVIIVCFDEQTYQCYSQLI